MSVNIGPAPSPSPILPFVMLLVMTFATAVVAFAQYAMPDPGWPGWDESFPNAIAYQMGMFIALFLTVRMMMLRPRAIEGIHYWRMGCAVISSLLVLQLVDLLVEQRFPELSAPDRMLNYTCQFLLAVAVGTSLFWRPRRARHLLWIEVSQFILLMLLIAATANEYLEANHFLFWAKRNPMELSGFVEFVLVELYVIALVLAGTDKTARVPDFGNGASCVGTDARDTYYALSLQEKAKHPPAKPLLYPVLQDLFLGGVVAWMLAIAGRGIKAVSGKSLWIQAREMFWLWYHDGIDPPSYYQLELYRPDHAHWPAASLTRFETKNGLFRALNFQRPQPYGGKEMNDKRVFAEFCAKHALPHPQILATVSASSRHVQAPLKDFATDLFCKKSHGMGATGTKSFRYNSENAYVDDGGGSLSLAALLACLQSKAGRGQYLVQPWLRNAPDIANLAGESLIAIRIVTVENESGLPEVALAMLRVLAKLEPDWKEALDGEYAAPIDVHTGIMGRFTGDNMRTSHLRYDWHPITGARVTGRKIAAWPGFGRMCPCGPSCLAAPRHYWLGHRVDLSRTSCA